jgi:hypothetical protein
MQDANPTLPREAPQTAADEALTDPRALEILTTEHSSLLATRSLAYNEAFSRASMFLQFLSASLIVIGFLISALGLTPTVGLLASILLGADLYIGVATASRLIGANREELQCVRGMNRIRHAYRDIVPELETYFVTGFHDDARGVLATYGEVAASGRVLRNILHGLGTTIGMISTIDALIFGALMAAISLGLGLSLGTAVILAVAGFLVAFGLFVVVGMRSAVGQQASAKSHFPTPD